MMVDYLVGMKAVKRDHQSTGCWAYLTVESTDDQRAGQSADMKVSYWADQMVVQKGD